MVRKDGWIFGSFYSCGCGVEWILISFSHWGWLMLDFSFFEFYGRAGLA
jgi:hypothetical protein